MIRLLIRLIRMATGPETIEAAFQYFSVVAFAGIVCKLLWDNCNELKELNKTIIDIMSMFAPRDETDNRINQLNSTVNQHSERISTIEEWQRHVDSNPHSKNDKVK